MTALPPVRNCLPLFVAAAIGVGCLSEGVVIAGDVQPDAAQLELFERQIRPLLVQNCFQCHGPDKQQSGLRVDSRTALLNGGDYGPALVPGEPDKSRLLQAVRYDDENLRMPPKGKLSDAEIAALAAWIKAGSPWPEVAGEVRPAESEFQITQQDRQFWSFQPVRPTEAPTVSGPPSVRGAAWGNSPIDQFILAKLEEKGLRPSPAADKRTLLRRATFDLTGLPPTPEEIEAFVADESPGAFAKVVDRLLASPHFGERWARHWLDVARYGEDQAHTFQARKYPDGWRYRDWVIAAFNNDMPYDQFIVEQIAGDLLDSADRRGSLAATGYFAMGPVYYGRSVADEMDDRIDTLCRGFLGLTVACARCHDHKFDPISQHDYYALQGIFSSTDYKEFVLTDEGRIDEEAKSDPTDKMSRDKKKDPRKPVIHALIDKAEPVNARVHIRGNASTLGEEVPRRFLSILAGKDAVNFTKGSGRLELAQAIASPENPLTARVLVNRVWHHLFGRGIVSTPSNFGNLGERPTHPELLDWLASRFMAEGWSMKTLIREVMLSATYQQQSRFDEASAGIDPDNHYLWRANRRRLEVEPWRDAMLAVAGSFDTTIGGPSIDLSASDNRRRTLYASISRHNLDPLLRLFDFPDPNLTSDRRPVTSVPLQQLYVLNGEFIARQAETLAERLLALTEQDDAARLQQAFVWVYGRPPRDAEVALALKFITANTEDAGGNEEERLRAAWQKYAQVLLSSNEFAFID